MSFIEELKRRNVVRVALLYVVAAWLLLQVTDVLASLLPVPGWTGSFIFVLLVIGFPLVLIFSWVYELTPEGLKRESEVDPNQTVTRETGRKLNSLTVVLLLLAIGAVIMDRLIPETGPLSGTTVMQGPDQARERAAPGSRPVEAENETEAPKRSVAVLPFVNMSADPEQEYFSDGLSEELLNLLSRVPDLTVASRTSAFSFKGKDVTIAQVAKTLNVSHILEGSVRKSGDRIRITAQLIDAERDVHLWSDTWDRTLDDIFAIQDEIAASVAEALKMTLLGERPQTVPTDPDAYNLYLQATYLTHQGSKKSLFEAIDLFNEVVAADPSYAPAWSGLSGAYINLTGSRALPRNEGFEAAKRTAQRALDVDPDNAEALSRLGWIAGQYEGDYEAEARYIERALDLEPNSDRVLNATAMLLLNLGRLEESLRIQGRLVEQDPVSPVHHHNLGVTYYVAGNLDAAEKAFDKALSLSPDMLLARRLRAYLFCARGQYQECLDAHESLTALTGNEAYRLAGQAIAYPNLGRPEEAAAAIALLERDYSRTFTREIAAAYAWQGQFDQAFEWLENLYEWQGAHELIFVQRDPALFRFRDDPRMAKLVKRVGLSAEQLAAIEFDVDTAD